MKNPQKMFGMIVLAKKAEPHNSNSKKVEKLWKIKQFFLHSEFLVTGDIRLDSTQENYSKSTLLILKLEIGKK